MKFIKQYLTPKYCDDSSDSGDGTVSIPSTSSEENEEFDTPYIPTYYDIELATIKLQQDVRERYEEQLESITNNILK